MAIGTRPPDTGQLPAAPPLANGHGPRLGGMRAVGRSARRRWWWAALAAVAAAGSLVAVDVSSASATYPVQAVFSRAPGLFPGASVEVLGVRVGTVTSVRNVANEVNVGLAVDRGRPVPRNATASLVTPQLLGEPSIELSPGYTRGPVMRPGTTIPEVRTAVPVSTEQLLKALEHMLRRVNPHGVGNLVTNLARDLKGQGKGLNTLIHGAAGTLRLLATKADDLGQLSGSLAQLTGTLDSRTSQISQLITDYDTVSGVVAQHSAQLGGAITQLSQASTQVVQLLVPNLTSLESDVGDITTVGRTLDRNLTSVDQTLAAATALFTGARRVYTPAHNWLTLNLQNPTGLTATLLAHQIADRLSGICRRVLAHHSSGLSAAQVKTLGTCSTPGFFTSVVSQTPTLMRANASGKTPAETSSPSQMLQKGMAEIPGLSPSQKSATSNPPPPTTSPSTTSTT
ncbi:MAG: MCE family protein, partial [Acidimicrobiales bacterium]